MKSTTRLIHMSIGSIVSLLLANGCTSVAGALSGWNGARLHISSPANLGTKSVFGVAWCTSPDRACQKSLRGTELKPGKVFGGGYSLNPSHNIRVPERIEVSWYDAKGLEHQQVVELNIPGYEEVIRRYGAPISAWDRKWYIVLIFEDDKPISYAWRLANTSDRDPKFKLPKTIVYWGNKNVLLLKPGEAEKVPRYEPENE